MADDDLVLPFAERLLACLCGLLEANDSPVCQCSLRPGVAPPPADTCCNCGDNHVGQAAVQVTNIYAIPYGRFPQQGLNGVLDNCAAYEWVADLTMTIYRCVSVADDKGFPSVNEMTADATRILNDAQVMRRAMLCCDWRTKVDDPDERWPIVPGRWTPLSPLGGCAGGQQTVTVLLGQECCPSP